MEVFNLFLPGDLRHWFPSKRHGSVDESFIVSPFLLCVYIYLFIIIIIVIIAAIYLSKVGPTIDSRVTSYITIILFLVLYIYLHME